MNETIEASPVTALLKGLMKKELNHSQSRDLAIALGYFEKNSCQEVRGYVLPKRIRDYFGSGAIKTLFFIGQVRMDEPQLLDFCKNKFNIPCEDIELIGEEFLSKDSELFNHKSIAVIFGNISGFRYKWMSGELLKSGIPFAEARTLDGNRKRKVTPRTLYRALYEIYFQRN